MGGSELLKGVTRRLPRFAQRAARRLDPCGVEQIYQGSYLSLAGQTPWLDRIPLASARGGTANYSLLYLLLNALRQPEIKRVLEIGVGSSSDLVTQWVAAGHGESVHVEHDAEWLARSIPEREGVTAIPAELRPQTAGNRSIEWYDTDRPSGRFGLVLVDGPPAWKKQDRFNRLGILDWIPAILDDEFVILIDDSSRRGESQLVRSCVELLRCEEIEIAVTQVNAADSQTVIATPDLRGLLYL